MNEFMKNKKLILNLAKKARRNISEVYDFVYNKTLRGACGVSSWHLMSLLQQHNINAKYCYCIGHYWVEVDDFVIDITAKQFDKKYPEILILSKKKYMNLPFIHSQQIDSINCTKQAFNEMSGWTYCVDKKHFKTLKKQQNKYSI